MIATRENFKLRDCILFSTKKRRTGESNCGGSEREEKCFVKDNMTWCVRQTHRSYWTWEKWRGSNQSPMSWLAFLNISWILQHFLFFSHFIVNPKEYGVLLPLYAGLASKIIKTHQENLKDARLQCGATFCLNPFANIICTQEMIVELKYFTLSFISVFGEIGKRKKIIWNVWP